VSRLLKLATAPWRLAKAARRHGLGPLLAFLIDSLRRHGMKGAFYFVVTDRRTRAERAVADSRAAAKRAEAERAAEAIEGRRRTAPPDLDERFGLAAPAWDLWRPWVGAAPPHPDPVHERFDDAAVLFVVQIDDAKDGEPLARTRAAVQRLQTAQMVVISPGSGEAIAWPTGPDDRFVVFLKAGDIPQANLARELACAARRGVADVVSFDMVRREGDVVYPLLLPGANPTLFAAVDYLFSRVALRGEALGEEASSPNLDPRARLLHWLAGRPATQIRGRWRHVGRPLVEVAVSADQIAQLREDALVAGRAPVVRPPDARVSVVICTKDKGRLLHQLVRSLLAYPGDAIVEIVIVANNTTNPYALETLADLAERPRVSVARRDETFNLSKLSNAGARIATRGSHLLFLHDDVAPVTPDWLDRLLSRFNDPDVAAAGPLLLYPDERVQHGGMYSGFEDGAGYTLRGASLPDEDYLFTGVAPRETSGLTGAVLLVERSAFDAIKGFDEQLATSLQDLDLGLRLDRIGRRNVFDPTSVLIHMDGASIQSLKTRIAFHRQRRAELDRFQARWGSGLKADRFHPKGFDLQDESLRRLSGAGGVRPPMKTGAPLPDPR